MEPGSLLLIIPLIVVVGCGLGFMSGHEVMIAEVEQRLGEGEKVRFPRASWNVFLINRLHRQFFPLSRVRARCSLLLIVGGAALGTIGLSILYFVLSKALAS